MDVREVIREFIIENFLMGDDGSSLRDDDSFLETRVIDSTGVLELVQFLEERFGISIPDEEILPENLDSVERIDRYLRIKLEGQRAAGGM